MSLTLSPCTHSDAASLAAVVVEAFGPAPRSKVMYRKVPLETQLQVQKQGLVQQISSQNDPNAPWQKHVLKVTDSASGDVMAFAIWCWLPNGYKPEEDSQTQLSEKGFPEGVNEAVIKDFWRKTGELRGQHVGRSKEHWLLHMLATHPKYERRGAAGLLIRWPFEQADREGKRCYVDSSVTGHQLYGRYGFEDVGEMRLELDKYEGGEGFGVQKWVAMVREPRKAT